MMHARTPDAGDISAEPVSISALQALLEEACERAHIPGASLAVATPAGVVTAVFGVASAATDQPVHPETLFLSGSITKVVTASLAMRAMERRGCGLDDPIAAWLPEFRSGDPISIRHLLTHTSGLDGDFSRPSWGDDALARLSEGVAAAPRDDGPGDVYSYNNSAFGVLGRLIEVWTGRNWDEAVRAEIIDPMDFRSMETLPWEAIVHPIAVGHVKHEDGGMAVARPWSESRASGPQAGLAASAGDLAAFGLGQLAEGPLNHAGQAAPNASQCVIPDSFADLTEQGLGWQIGRSSAGMVLGHNGWMLGQSSYLRVMPQRQLALCLLTNVNGFTSGPVFDEVWSYAKQSRSSFDPEPPGVATPGTADVAGLYRSRHRHAVVGGSPRRLDLTLSGSIGVQFDGGSALSGDLEPAGAAGRYYIRTPSGSRLPISFSPGAQGSGMYLHLGGRAMRAV